MKKIFFLITVSLALFSCKGDKEKEAPSNEKLEDNVVTLTDAQYKNAGIKTGKLEQQSVSSTLKVNGKIDVPPQNMVSVSVPLGGYLKSTKLLPGMHINKGDVLAVIEDQQYIQLQQDYLTAKAQYSYNESEYNRQKELNLTKTSSDKVYEQAKATYQTQAILIKALEEKLRLIGINPVTVSASNISRQINIYSPITGFVSAVNVNIGKFVNPADVLFELVNPEDIHLALDVFEKDVNKIFIGQKLFAYTNNQPEKKYPCEVILISKKISAERSAEVHCHFEKYDKTLLPGMFMNADIEVKSNNAKTLPDEAIIRYENKQYVFIEKGSNKFIIQQVTTGVSENGFTEIIIDEKLSGETFVTGGAYNLLMKLKNTADE